MIRKLMATLIQIMDWVNMPFIKPTLQQLKSIFPQRCHVLRYGVLGEGGMNRRSWGALHSSGRNNYVNTCKLFQISICLEWGEWYELRRQTLTVIIGRCCSISDCLFILGKPPDKNSAVFFNTRPKPAYGRQGLDWIVGPGYSFVVFSTNKTMGTNQKPW